MPSLHRLLLRPAFAAPADLRGRHAVVTGTAPGSIGYETARRLAAWGATVTVSTRSDPRELVERLRRDSGGEVRGHALDLAAPASVRAFAQACREDHGARLDILVNNAGVHLDLLSQ